MHNEQKVYGKEIPNAFANYFDTKVNDITESCEVDPNVYNGREMTKNPDENFIYETRVKRIMMNLKIKNCEGIDRIPLRILNDGAEQLYT